MIISEGKTIGMGQFNKPTEKKDAVHINKIAGEVIHITGFTHTRGRPSRFTKDEDIGEDGLTDYYTIDTSEVFDLEKGDETKPINCFFVTPAIKSQIERVPNVQEEFANGNRLGPVKPIKRKSQKTGTDYWCLAFPEDEDYE